MNLVSRVYALTQVMPKEEQYGLTSQMRRASVSVPANIAEGAARQTPAELTRYLYIARGSLSELETLVQVSRNLGMLTSEAATEILDRAGQVGKLLEGLMLKVRSSLVTEEVADYNV